MVPGGARNACESADLPADVPEGKTDASAATAAYVNDGADSDDGPDSTEPQVYVHMRRFMFRGGAVSRKFP